MIPALPSLVLLAALGAQPAPAPTGIAVVILHNADVPAASAQALGNAIADILKDQGVAVTLDPAAAAKLLEGSDPCAGRKDCAPVVGVKLGLAVIIGIDVAAAGKSGNALYLEAVNVSDGTRQATRELMTPPTGLSPQAHDEIDAFARELAKKLKVTVEVTPPTDVPRNPDPIVAVAPRPREVTGVVAVLPPQQSSRTAFWAFGGGAAVTAAASIGFGIAAGVLGGKISGDANHYVDMTRDEANAAVPRQHAFVATSIATGVAALALGTVAYLLYTPAPAN